MKFVYPTFSFRGALFAAVISFASMLSWMVAIVTLGWIGKEWPLKLAWFSLGHPWNTVYDACQDDSISDN